MSTLITIGAQLYSVIHQMGGVIFTANTRVDSAANTRVTSTGDTRVTKEVA